MAKPDNLGLIVFLGVLVGCLCTLVFWMLFKFSVQEAQGKQQRRENEKAALVLREQREKLEQLLKAVKTTEKGKE